MRRLSLRCVVMLAPEDVEALDELRGRRCRSRFMRELLRERADAERERTALRRRVRELLRDRASAQDLRDPKFIN